MPASPFAPHAGAWRALPAETRNAVAAAARKHRPAPDLATATAAVQYGRHVRRHGTRLGVVLAVTMIALLSVGAMIGHGIPPLPHQSVDGTIRDLVIAAFIMGGLSLIAIIEAEFGISGLIRTNLPIVSAVPAAAFEDAAPDLKIGRRWPLPTGILEVTLLCAGIVTMPLMHNYLTAVALVAALGAYLFVGPAVIQPSTATMTAAGIQLPRWHARIPWSVHTVTLIDDRRVRVSVLGAFESTGPLPSHWANRIAGLLQPGQTFTITCREPEIAAWTARRHLDTHRRC